MTYNELQLYIKKVDIATNKAGITVRYDYKKIKLYEENRNVTQTSRDNHCELFCGTDIIV